MVRGHRTCYRSIRVETATAESSRVVIESRVLHEQSCSSFSRGNFAFVLCSCCKEKVGGVPELDHRENFH